MRRAHCFTDAARGAALVAAGEYPMYDVLRSEETGVIAEAIVETAWPGVSAGPGTRQLALFEQESIMTPEHRLKNAMWGRRRA